MLCSYITFACVDFFCIQRRWWQSKALCKQCFAGFATPQRNMENLYNHLKHYHKIQCVEATEVKKTSPNKFHSTTQISITETLYSASPYVIDSPWHKEIIETITYHQARDMAPTLWKTREFKKWYTGQVFNTLPQLFFKCWTAVEAESEKCILISLTRFMVKQLQLQSDMADEACCGPKWVQATWQQA